MLRRVPIEPAFRVMMPSQSVNVFVSYSHADAPLVAPVVKLLRVQQKEIFVFYAGPVPVKSRMIDVNGQSTVMENYEYCRILMASSTAFARCLAIQAYRSLLLAPGGL